MKVLIATLYAMGVSLAIGFSIYLPIVSVLYLIFSPITETFNILFRCGCILPVIYSLFVGVMVHTEESFNSWKQ